MQLNIDFSRTRFNGPEYRHLIDQERLNSQLKRVFAVLAVGEWYTLREISMLTKDPEASISAQIRHLRKPRFGSYTIEKRRRGEEKWGLYEYHMVIEMIF